MATDPRTVYVRAAPLPNAAELRWPAKTPADGVPCSIDVSGWLAAGDTVLENTITFSAAPSDVTAALVANSFNGSSWTFMVAGGSLPSTGNVTDYQCTVAWDTQLGATGSRAVWMQVAPLSQNAGYPGLAVSVIAGEAGRSIIDFVQPTATTLQVNFSDGTNQALDLPAGAAGRGISSVTQPSASSLLVTFSDGSTAPFTLPVGRGIASVVQTSATTLQMTLTDGTTTNYTLPAGRGITSVTQPAGSGSAQITFSDGTTASLILPSGTPGAPGQTIYQNGQAIAWNATTNTGPVLSAGGQVNGVTATPGASYLVTQAGSATALDGYATGRTSWAIGDLVLAVTAGTGGVAWVQVPNGGALGAVSSLFITNATVSDNGDGKFGLRVTDGGGGIWFLIDSAGTAHMVNVSIAGGLGVAGTTTLDNLVVQGSFTGPLPTVQDAFSNTLLSADPANSRTLLPGLALEVGSAGIINLVNGNDRQIYASFNSNTGSVTLWNLSVLGTFTGGALASTSSTFAQSDINYFDTLNLAYSAAILSRTNTTAMQGTAQLNVQLTLGESRTVGTYGAPPLTTVQPLDVLMYGQNTHGVPKSTTDPTIATFSTVGSGLNPCVATDITNGSYTLSIPRTGFFNGVEGVQAFVGTDGNGTFTCTGAVNFAAVFENGDGFQCEGFANATGNNASVSNALTFSCLSAGVDVLVAGPVNGNATNMLPAATSAPENGITFAQANYSNFGEDPSVAENIEFRWAQLRQRGLAGSDPTRVNVVSVCGIAQVVPAQSPANNGITPNPFYWNRIVTCLQGLNSQAAALGKTIALNAVDIAFGGDESGNGQSKASYRADLAFMLSSVSTLAAATFGATQTAPPYVYSFAQGGAQLNDGSLPHAWVTNTAYTQFQFRNANGNTYICAAGGTSAATGTGPSGTGQGIADGTCLWNFAYIAQTIADICPIPTATLELFGCSPLTGYPWNYPGCNQNYICIGPEYFGPDRGQHGNNNGYIWTGLMRAKARIRVELLGQGFAAMHAIRVAVRGKQVLIGHHVPVPPLQVQCPLSYDAPQTLPAFGYELADANGALTITSSVVAGLTNVIHTCSRAPQASTLVWRYAPAAFNGAGMICDSDQWQPALTKYLFVLGNGSLLSDNFPNPAVSGGLILQNGQPFPLWNWNCPAGGMGAVTY